MNGDDVPLANIYVWKGISEEAIEKIIRGITDVFVNLGIPEQAVEVIVNEVPKSHWGISGLPATKIKPNAKPP
ncbi:MAG: tautomerase family protein [Promethearchaeota archaeon]